MTDMAVVDMLPVAEIFGPTMQGEGPFVGEVCYFIRLGGCDFRCVWCDSSHAVLPEKVRELPRMEVWEIVDTLKTLMAKSKVGFMPLFVISGGNPAMMDLAPLIRGLRAEWGCRIQIETQGTIYPEWFREVDHVVVSPKPPSSGMNHKPKIIGNFMEQIRRDLVPHSIKVVVFNQMDLYFALDMGKWYLRPGDTLYLSVGTLPTSTTQELLDATVRLFEWVTNLNLVAPDFEFSVRILPQLHVLYWGHKLGV